MPDSCTEWVSTPSDTVKIPVRKPFVVGVNVTWREQDEFAGSVVPQLLAWPSAKSPVSESWSGSVVLPRFSTVMKVGDVTGVPTSTCENSGTVDDIASTSPVPLSAALALGEPLALLMVRLPGRLPTSCGASFTAIWQVPPPARVLPQEFEAIRYSPVSTAAPRLVAMSPVFWSVSTCEGDVVLLFCGEKASEAGEKARCAGVSPLPPKATCAETPPPPVSRSTALRAPAPTGVNAAATVQTVPGSRLPTQPLLVIVKSREEICGAFRGTVTPPLFLKVAVCAALLPPVTVSG